MFDRMLFPLETICFMVCSLVSARVNYLTHIFLYQNIDFLTPQTAKCRVRDEASNLKMGCDNALPDQGYRTRQGVLIDEAGAMMQYRLAWRNTCP
jgi:hypothetical protein